MARLSALWHEITTSLWFAPGVMVAVACLLAAATLRLDELLAWGGADAYGGVDGARGVLTAIGGAVVAVIAITLSLTVVALQLAASQFTPRILRPFITDRPTSIVLGFLSATFAYALLVLRVVGTDEAGTPFVPTLSVGSAILLGLISVAVLIYGVDHVVRSMQVSVIIDRTADDVRRLIDALYPEPLSGPAEAPVEPSNSVALPPDAATVVSRDGGYVQVIDLTGLVEAARLAGATVYLETVVGAYVIAGEPVAHIAPASAVGPELERAVLDALYLGFERTLQDDLALGVRSLVDIALRGLSPAINDPTTATLCVDRLVELIARLGNRRWSDGVLRDEAGQVRVVARGRSFEEIVSLGFDQIRHSGAADVVFAAHVLDALGRLARLLPPERRPAIAAQIEALRRQVHAAGHEPGDLERLDRLAARALAECRSGGRAAAPVA